MSDAGEVAVVLVGHGSARHPDSAQPIHALAAALTERHGWPAAAVFMKQAPLLDQALDLVNARRVVVVPVFAGKGYYTDQLIPKAMGLTGAVTERDGRTIHYTAPAGTHPRIPGLMACRAAGVAMADGLALKDCSLLVIAHGSARPGGSGETPRAIAESIRAMDAFGEVVLAFLEQEPFATNWRDLVKGRELVVLPLLVAQGMHASQDIPPLFGLEAGQTGPVAIDGRRARLASGLGAEPDLVDIVAELVRGAL
ncbi:MAG TPA: CbiX/SirB N-terminal domain-containing protein [Candidatus Omnitrophota bacterium]|nr:CbiX/SirB N-terminal domain-containing protein [Candidatus Omnitrophota bacterium]